ncbi:hypothetical protein A2917_00230 [Candidatus Nomurabacteria bacterium RIFCSPLOWO2_01_FULL_42_17]|uniref:Glycosidase n=1 Tax=Candidatus Nomurabacteria bacterium RIFCSPLOWO2_01_FULL_42_17 TaxID=1801780 RepID=A0A1F6XNM8_9BACT|nr:MAG: hypothetical protein A2917_00230 [Candidatus Nomurabacteria bacterium RIFCSPLOWO2_01_FULL_42_17]
MAAPKKKTTKRLNGSGSRIKSSAKRSPSSKRVVRRVGAEVRRRKIKTAKIIKIGRKVTVLDLKRFKKNPIIEPTSKRYWESKATFNPTALYHDGKVHIVYRAIGDSDNSVLGYAVSKDGVTISKSLPEPVYFHCPPQNRDTFPLISLISYGSGGGWGGGCEDPRLTLLGDRLYMIYTAFDGWGSVRMTLTSISLEDFISHRWNWRSPVLISPPGQINKNWVLFPEKIKKDGKEKYAILHSISPRIMIDYLDSLDELDGTKYIYSIHQGSPMWGARDKLIRGVGPTPLHTKYGWLILYHKMEKGETHRYKLWAMILDLKDPTKILYDSKQPILEPDEWYENEGYKEGVVYSCGAIIKDGKLFVYYGGADKVSCVATADLDKFLQELTQRSGSKLKINIIKR